MEIAQTALRQAIQVACGLEIDPVITVAEPSRGDFACNVAFILAGQLKRSPQELAAAISAAVAAPLIRAEAAGGYVNLILNDKYWAAELAKVVPGYGHTQEGKGQKIQVEFISANPTGPLTLGNARGGFIGDVIGNVLATQGYETVKEYYFNDAGTQISHLVKAFRAAAGQPVEGELQYQGEYIRDLAEAYEPKMAEHDDAYWAGVLTKVIFERYIRPAIEAMGITFDVFTNEGELAAEFTTIRKFLADKGVIEEEEGAVWLRSTRFGDKRDRVLVKSNGDVTYLGNDIAYHYDVFAKRGFDRAIKVWGADHADQVPSLQLTIKELFPDKQLAFVILQWVRLIRNGQEVKMSKRAGTFVTVAELIEELDAAVGTEYGAAVARFFFLMRSVDTQMDFDLDLAKEQSQKNPLFYVLYSYARACSILDKAAEQGLTQGGELAELTKLERTVVKKLAEWPQLLQQVAADYSVHRLTFYGRELAKLFHDYYEAERIIDLPPKAAAGKLYLVKKYADFLESYFAMLGITPSKRLKA